MKKFLLLGFVGAMMLSCKPTMDTKSQYGLKGSWTLTNVSNIGGDYVKITSFDIADAKCFKNSQWKFVSNNNSGTVNLTGGNGCPTYDGNFKWFITPSGEFEFKFVGQGEKAKKVTTGYKMKVQNQSTDSFELVNTFYVGGQGYDVTYHFQRN